LDALTGADKRMSEADFDLRLGYVGAGYGVPSPAGEEAFDWLWRKEGVLLDPVYSAKAFSGLLDLARKGEIEGRVLFWHTGGLPTLFATER
jgi:1-aminocyclopropane-1-carboxylate deaminase/D-cysteine desulfhydrase-like pyridoxal-dependent ACC family enzyme